MNDIDTASLAAKIGGLEARAAKAAKLEAALDECVTALTYPAQITSKHGNVPETLRHLADLMAEAGDKNGWVLWVRRTAAAMDVALAQAQEMLGHDFADVASNPPFGREELPQLGPHRYYPKRPAGEYRTPPEMLDALEENAE